MRYGFTWCEEHKKNLEIDYKYLKKIITEKYEIAESSIIEQYLEINNIYLYT